MVDFRYHVVSIIAVFLALALGIVLGTYSINGQVLKNIRHQVSSLRGQNDDLRGRIQDLEGAQKQSNALTKAVAPLVVKNRLTRQRVVVITTPGADQGVVNNVKDAITKSGGSVSATVKMTKGWADPTQQAVIGELASRLAEPGLTLPSGSAYERAGRVLATALLRHPPAASGSGSLSSADTTALAGFRTAGLISVSPSRPAPATLAVLVVGDAPGQPDDATVAASRTFADLVRELDAAGGGAVVAGPPAAAEPSGVIAVVRGDGDERKVVSTVDDADTDAGRIRVVLALAAELDNSSGQYGVGPGANAAAPSPVPVPSP